MHYTFPLRILCFSCYELSLDFKSERILKKIPEVFPKHNVSYEQMEHILKHKCTFI